MSGTRADIARAEAEAAAAKLRVGQTVDRLKRRLNPRLRAQETWEDVREKGETLSDDALEFAYERPGTIAAVAGAGTLFLLRRPIVRLLRRLAFWRRLKWDGATPPKNTAPAAQRPSGKGGERR